MKIQTLSLLLEQGNNTLANKYFKEFINQIALDILLNKDYFDNDALDAANDLYNENRDARTVSMEEHEIGIDDMDIWIDVDYDYAFRLNNYDELELEDIDVTKVMFYIYDAEFNLTDNKEIREQIIKMV